MDDHPRYGSGRYENHQSHAHCRNPFLNQYPGGNTAKAKWSGLSEESPASFGPVAWLPPEIIKNRRFAKTSSSMVKIRIMPQNKETRLRKSLFGRCRGCSSWRQSDRQFTSAERWGEKSRRSIYFIVSITFRKPCPYQARCLRKARWAEFPRWNSPCPLRKNKTKAMKKLIKYEVINVRQSVADYNVRQNWCPFSFQWRHEDMHPCRWFSPCKSITVNGWTGVLWSTM